MSTASVPLLLVLWLALLHYLGDFRYQSDAMAVNKSTSNRWLSVHVGVYTLFLLAGTWSVTFALVNGVLHWVTDYLTSRWTSRLWKAGKIRAFFNAVGVDQLVHYATLYITACWLLT